MFQVYFLPHQRNIIVCKYKLHEIWTIMKYRSWTFFWYWYWKNLFFNVKLKLLMIKFNFSQFHEHIFRSSRSQMFFKIGVFKSLANFIKGKHLCWSPFLKNLSLQDTSGEFFYTSSGCFLTPPLANCSSWHIVWCIKRRTHLFINLFLIVMFSK